MPAARQVFCPTCGAGRVVRAARGTWLTCPACGARYRCPEPPADGAPAEPPARAPRVDTSHEAPPGPVAPPAPPSGPTVVRASGATVKISPPTATSDEPAPSPRGAPSAEEGERPGPGDPPPGGGAPSEPVDREEVRRRVAKERGRRGGARFYRDQVLRGR